MNSNQGNSQLLRTRYGAGQKGNMNTSKNRHETSAIEMASPEDNGKVTRPITGAASDGDKGPSREDIEYANINRTIAWGLVGTCIAILTFLLIIYYDVASAGEFDPLLFQLSLSVVTISLFLMSFAGSYYFRVVLPIRKKDMKAAYHIRVADNLFFLGFMSLAAEPPLILLTVKLYYAAAIAVILWLAAVVLGYRIRREFQ